MKDFLINLILWTWCLPQSLSGFFYYIYFRNGIKEKYKHNNILICSVDTENFRGISLGKFIFLGNKHSKEDTLKHEYGHTLQNYIFGPIYFIVIGIPSVLQFLISKYIKDVRKQNFYHFPENWANKLGGLKK